MLAFGWGQGTTQGEKKKPSPVLLPATKKPTNKLKVFFLPRVISENRTDFWNLLQMLKVGMMPFLGNILNLSMLPK